MRLKLLSTSATLALLSGPAFALTNDLGTISSGYSNAFGGGYVDSPDKFDFTTTQAEYLQLSATVANTSVEMGGVNLVLTGPTAETSGFVKSGSWGAAISASYPGVKILAGNYQFSIEPAATSGDRAAVGYSMDINGVPEISTWAMLLAGFAALGFAGYRRKTFSPAL